MNKLTDNKIRMNRQTFLNALRSGKYPKGTINTDSKGRPIIESEKDEGYCVVGLMFSLFEPIDYRTALGLTTAQTRKVQQVWNDSSLTFPEIADLIEEEML